jgi:phage-related baseplate assembly protein
MPLIINSSGKIELITPVDKYLRSAAYQDYMTDLYNQLTKVATNQSLSVATGEALDRLANIYDVRRMDSCPPDGEYGGCNEESDEALRTRLRYIARGYV